MVRFLAINNSNPLWLSGFCGLFLYSWSCFFTTACAACTHIRNPPASHRINDYVAHRRASAYPHALLRAQRSLHFTFHAFDMKKHLCIAMNCP